ncbi:MAG: ATPase [Geobacter sp.]|nr:ATPase [Geobacter sp.]
MKSVVFITPPDARFGFSLSGVIQQTVSPEQALETLKTVLDDPETGVVIIDERLLGGIGEERFREMERRWYGVLLILPAPEKLAAEGEDYLQRLIRRAIGYHVRLQG